MISPRMRAAIGHGLLGLAIGILLFSIFYIATFRTGIAVRFVWSWVAIHLLVLLGPAIILALYGANKAKAAPTA